MIFLNLLVSFVNFWIWKIFQENWLMGIILSFVSFLLYFLAIKFNKKFFIIFFILYLFLSSQILISGTDKNLTHLTVDGQKQLNARHGYFSIELGKLFQNKLSLHFYKDVYPYISIYGSNVFNALSPNLYFFENHPREREKVGEFPKYPGVFIIPFIVGFLLILKSVPNILVGYFLLAILLCGFIRQNYFPGPILFYPLINFLITNGIIKLYKIIKNVY